MYQLELVLSCSTCAQEDLQSVAYKRNEILEFLHKNNCELKQTFDGITVSNNKHQFCACFKIASAVIVTVSAMAALFWLLTYLIRETFRPNLSR